jgi:redox-sensing transcriptional repressor
MARVSESSVRRLSLYLRLLEDFAARGESTVSSEALAARVGTTGAQVRKDLSFFGSFGKRGFGYSVPELSGRLRDILGLERTYSVAVIGAGKVGSALIRYPGFRERGFHVVAAYDVDPGIVGRRVGSVTVRSVDALEAEMNKEPVDIGVLATPREAAQDGARRLIRAGVKAILNFAPVPLEVPPDVAVKHVNLTLELEAVSYALRNR